MLLCRFRRWPVQVPRFGTARRHLRVGSGSDVEARVSFDSQVEFNIQAVDELFVRKMKTPLKLLHPPGHSFYDVCRSKLDWASRVGDKLHISD